MRKYNSWRVLLAAGMVVMSLASCLGSDDDDEQEVMTPDKYRSYMTEMSGSYSGMTYYFSQTPDGYKADSVGVSAQILGVGDSLINVTNVPAKLLARCVSDTVMRKAVEKESDLRLQMKYYITAFYQSILTFGVYPMSVTFDDLEYREGQHQVVFNFVTYMNALGAYSNGKVEVTCYLLDVWEDGKQKETFYSIYDSTGYNNSKYMLFMALQKRKDSWDDH